MWLKKQKKSKQRRKQSNKFYGYPPQAEACLVDAHKL